MANSFSTQGSNVANPIAGLLTRPANPLPTDPRHIAQGLFGSSKNPLAPAAPGAPQYNTPQPPAPSTPVKSTTDSQGNTTTYHAPTTVAPDDAANKYNTTTGLLNPNYKDPSAPVGSTSTTPTQPTSSNPQVGTTKENYQNVLNQSAPTALSTGAATANSLYGMLGNERQLQPFAGGQTQGLDQSYANLTRPQSTGNLAGESGLFDVQRGILQNAAQSTASNALAQQGLATQGASTVAGASNLYPTSQGQASFSALGGYQDGGNYFGPAGDPQTAVNKAAFDSLGGQTAQLTADLNGFTANSNLLTNTIGKAGANSGNVPYLTALNQMIQRGVASQADLAAFQAMVTQLQQKGVTISPDLSLGAIKKELDGQIALKQNTITGNQNQMAQLKSGGSSGSSTGGGLYHF